MIGRRDVVTLICCLGLLAVVGLPPLLLDMVVIDRAIIDFPLILDTAQRWQFDHWPHLDYRTPIGAAFWLVQGLGVEIIGLHPKSLFAANLLSAGAIGLGGYALVRSRMSAVAAILLMVGTLLLVVSPRMIGGPIGEIAYLAPYNKTGLALLAVLITAFLVEPLEMPRRMVAGLQALVAAGLLTWLVYLKLNFAAIAVICGTAAFTFAPINRTLVALTFAVTAFAVVVIGAITGVGAAYVSDLQAIAAVNPLFRWQKLPLDLLASTRDLTAFFVACAAYLLWSRAALVTRVKTMAVAFGLLTAGILAMNQVHENALPLIFVAVLGLAARARREPLGDQPMPGRWRLGLAAFHIPLAAAGLLLINAVIADSMTMARYDDYQHDGHAKRFCADPAVPACAIAIGFFPTVEVADLPAMVAPNVHDESQDDAAIAVVARNLASIDEDAAPCADDYRCVYWLLYRQLFVLLNATMTVDDRPLFLGFANILPFYYGVAPPRGVLAWFDIDRSLLADAYPDPDRLFADVTLLAIPNPAWPHVHEPGLEALYKTAIERLFVKIAETEAWSIWRKRE